jgi:hypothetical protein
MLGPKGTLASASRVAGTMGGYQDTQFSSAGLEFPSHSHSCPWSNTSYHGASALWDVSFLLSLGVRLLGHKAFLCRCDHISEGIIGVKFSQGLLRIWGAVARVVVVKGNGVQRRKGGRGRKSDPATHVKLSKVWIYFYTVSLTSISVHRKKI